MTRLLSACCLLLILLAGRPALAEQPFTVGILALRPLAETQARWQPLADHLTQALPGHRVTIQAMDYPDLEQALLQNRLDFVFTHPTHYLQIRSRNALSGTLATLVERAGSLPVEAIGGTIFTLARRDDLHTLADLRGRTIASCSSNCMEGYQLAIEAFMDARVPPPDPASTTGSCRPSWRERWTRASCVRASSRSCSRKDGWTCRA